MARAARFWAPLLGALVLCSCERSPDAPPAALAGGPLYFDRADLAAVPPRLASAHLVDADAARERAETYVGYFDPPGRLLTFERLERGQTEWLQRYRYDEAGRVQRRYTIRRDRTVEIEHFDQAGSVERRESKSLEDVAGEVNDGG